VVYAESYLFLLMLTPELTFSFGIGENIANLFTAPRTAPVRIFGDAVQRPSGSFASPRAATEEDGPCSSRRVGPRALLHSCLHGPIAARRFGKKLARIDQE